MKYGLLVSRSLAHGNVDGMKNIGDYIQTLAAKQFMPVIDEYYDKTADDTGKDRIKMIMNAWYIWNPEKFPCSDRIIPLPISMHISPLCAERLLSLPKVANWFKKNEPIGCRDKETAQFLKSKGIETYFSGCLTLTLGKCYNNTEKHGLVFVDPYVAKVNHEIQLSKFLKSLFFSVLHFGSWIKLNKRFQHSYCIGRFHGLKQLFYSTVFLKTYSNVFSLKELRNSLYVAHMVKVGKGTNLNTEEEKIMYAEQLVKQYASSELVVTSRIHCALPCLGVETSVLFTTGNAIEKNSPKSSAGRFTGLINLFNVARISQTEIVECPKFPIVNKDDYKVIANDLTKRCTEFMQQESL